MLKAHITKKPINDDSIWYGKISSVGRCGCKSGNRYHLDSFYYGNIFKYYYYNGLDDRDEISKTYHKSRGFNGEKTDKDADFCIFGTQTELENWKYFIYNKCTYGACKQERNGDIIEPMKEELSVDRKK